MRCVMIVWRIRRYCFIGADMATSGSRIVVEQL